MIRECRERHAMLSRGIEQYRREIRFEHCRGHRPIVSVMFMPLGAPTAAADDKRTSVFDTAHGKLLAKRLSTPARKFASI